MKSTAVAPSNIAFIKYWGKKDEVLRIPLNGSVSMNLSNLLTTTTVEFDPRLKKDTISINRSYVKSSRLRHSGDQAEPETPESPSFKVIRDSGQARMTALEKTSEKNRVTEHLDKIRALAKIDYKARVISKNNFPISTGLSSSASGFAALTLAASKAAGLNLSERELSILARLGSGSACRSIPDGFVEWLDGATNETSYAISVFTADHWDIADIVAIVSKDKKEIPTTEGQKLANSSPFFPVRLARIKEKIKLIKKYMQEKNFPAFGELLEQETLELHAIMLTSTPPLIYWLPATLNVMHAVQKWRKEGLEVYFTVNTGQDIHLICQKQNKDRVKKKVLQMPGVAKVIANFSTIGARIVKRHLF